jgi:phage shock protein C
MSEVRKLTRSTDDRMLAGVCGGLAVHFGIDPTIVRVIFVLLSVFGGGGLVLYVAMWLLVPPASEVAAASGATDIDQPTP